MRQALQPAVSNPNQSSMFRQLSGPSSQSDSSSQSVVKALAVVAVAGVHLAVAAAIWLSSDTQTDLALPDAAVQYVEIADVMVDTVPGKKASEANAAEPEQPPDPQSVLAPELEPPEPETAVSQSSKSERLPKPEMTVPEPEVKPSNEVVSQTKPEPRPEPKREIKPKSDVKPKSEPEHKRETAHQPPQKPLASRDTVEQTNPAASAAPNGAADSPAPPKAPSGPVDPDRPRVVGQVDYAGKRPVPQYPRQSVRRGETGRVVVRILISSKGAVTRATVQKSSGYRRLDEAALEAARSARFKPYTENGMAYPALADIPFDFVL